MILNKKVYIHNYWYVTNYGATLTAYALYSVIDEIGYSPLLVDISSYQRRKNYLFYDFENF